ncbi:MAG: hypothetical protein JRD05_00670 [Deltaproteobacteria bacterium]|nr:hypothetical protein [Deltaproteobacteria bacterium]
MSGIFEYIARMMAPGLKDDDQIREIIAEEIKQAKMALPISANYDPNNDGYRRLSDADQRRRDLMPIAQDRMFEIIYFMWDSSAMMRRLAIMDRSFLFGGKVKVTSDDDEVQKIIDRFWKDPENRMDIDFPDMAMWLGLLGEQCWPVNVNEINGHVRLGYVDPTNIADVYVNPMNVKQVMQVKMQGSAGREGKRYAVIRKDYNMRSKSYDRLVGDCFFFSINRPLNSPRGRSDFLTLVDWIDALERYGFNFLERAELLNNFIWDVQLKGMDEEQMRAWLRDNPPPEPGSMRAHNENVEWKAVAPDLKSTDASKGFDMGKAFVMGAAGRPPSWFGEGGKAYQTEADQFGQVPVMDLEQRQGYLTHILEMVIQFVIDQAVIAKRLTPAAAEAGFSVNMPEISKKDLTKLVNGVPQLTTALTMAEQSKWITRDTATNIFAFVSSNLGFEIDVQAQIDAAGEAVPDDEIDYEEKDVVLENETGEIAKVSLNGAQIASLLKIVQSVAAGTLERASALQIITTAFPIDTEAAEKIMGGAGRGFKIKEAEKV